MESVEPQLKVQNCAGSLRQAQDRRGSEQTGQVKSQKLGKRINIYIQTPRILWPTLKGFDRLEQP